jgi:hypothetical protein
MGDGKRHGDRIVNNTQAKAMRIRFVYNGILRLFRHLLRLWIAKRIFFTRRIAFEAPRKVFGRLRITEGGGKATF